MLKFLHLLKISLFQYFPTVFSHWFFNSGKCGSNWKNDLKIIASYSEVEVDLKIFRKYKAWLLFILKKKKYFPWRILSSHAKFCLQLHWLTVRSQLHISGSIQPWNKNRQLVKSWNAKGKHACIVSFYNLWNFKCRTNVLVWKLLNFILIGSIQWETQPINKTEYIEAAWKNKHDRSMGMLWYPTNQHNNLFVALLMLYLSCCILQLRKDMHLQLKSMKS